MGFVAEAGAAPESLARDHHDHARLRHARERHEGFSVGRYLQPAPMLFTRDGHNVFLGDVYRGRAAFLICSGPSLLAHDLSLLIQRGVLTMAVNNAATVHRPNLWCSVDDPGNFADAIWRDPAIIKFTPLCHMEKHFTVRDDDGELVASTERVGDMPAVFGYRRNENFVAGQWLYEDTFNWGNHAKRTDADGNRGSRSVMYVALRLLFYLGIRRVYLLGCDFRMNIGDQNYAFEQDRSSSSVRGNNDSYRVLNARLGQLQPYFEQEGFEVFNCTPDSGLTVFKHVPYKQAVSECVLESSERIVTSGMYDRSARKKMKSAAPSGVDKSEALPVAITRRPSRPVRIPDAIEIASQTTIATIIGDDVDVRRLRRNFASWSMLDPSPTESPLIVTRPELYEAVNHALREVGECTPRIAYCEEVRGAEGAGFALEALKHIAENADTPRLLILHPGVTRTSRSPWFDP